MQSDVPDIKLRSPSPPKQTPTPADLLEEKAALEQERRELAEGWAQLEKAQAALLNPQATATPAADALPKRVRAGRAHSEPPGAEMQKAQGFMHGVFDFWPAKDRDRYGSVYHREIERGKKARFFRVGRDFKSMDHVHQFTLAERQKMHSFEALDYHRPISKVYKHHLELTGPRIEWLFEMLVVAMIGLVVGGINFVLKQTIDWLVAHKWDVARSAFDAHDVATRIPTSGIVLGFSLALILTSALLCVCIAPHAAGSGVPEVMAYLNGVLLPKVFNLKTLLVKWFSCILAVSSGMPMGPEGPMIHMGAAVGAGVSRGRSRTLGWDHTGCADRLFRRLRNNRDHRDFIACGAAAGVAAISAPVGGMLFVLEEIASWYDLRLVARIFFCCMVASMSSMWLNGTFDGWRIDWSAPWALKHSIHYKERLPVQASVLAFLPAVLLGLAGGLTGMLFTYGNLKATRYRARVLRDTKSLTLLEPCVLALIYCSIAFWLPFVWPCSPLPDVPNAEQVLKSHRFHLVDWICPREGEYSPMATLTYNGPEEVLKSLFAHQLPGLFHRSSLLVYLILYFTFACYSAGTSVASGLVIPSLIIGAGMGRLVGEGLHWVLAALGMGTEWADPGLFAFVGAGAFFGGVSRLTVSLVVIMLELTGSLNHLLPLMTAVMTAKWVADGFTHPLYHALLQVKCIPFLDSEPHVSKLDLFTARTCMASPPVTVSVEDSVKNYVDVLQTTDHNAFPVVSKPGSQIMVGAISRRQLEVVLGLDESILLTDDRWLQDSAKHVGTGWYTDIIQSQDKRCVRPRGQRVPILSQRVYEANINLAPYMDCSPWTVPESFSLANTYCLFRTMGLRHLFVMSGHEVIGVLTRKDLLGQQMQEALHRASPPSSPAGPSTRTWLLPSGLALERYSGDHLSQQHATA